MPRQDNISRDSRSHGYSKDHKATRTAHYPNISKIEEKHNRFSIFLHSVRREVNEIRNAFYSFFYAESPSRSKPIFHFNEEEMLGMSLLEQVKYSLLQYIVGSRQKYCEEKFNEMTETVRQQKSFSGVVTSVGRGIKDGFRLGKATYDVYQLEQLTLTQLKEYRFFSLLKDAIKALFR